VVGVRTRVWVSSVGTCAVLLAGCSSGAGAPADVAGAPRALASATTPAACTVPAKLAGKDVERLPVKEKLVALTFDAGANADGVPSILKTLHDLGVRATFFLTGDFVQAFPKKSAAIGKSYLVGNHTRSHPDLTKLGDRAVRRQVRDAEKLILAATGQDPRRFFRFPFGARTPHLVTVLNGLCYVPFRWTVDTLGWKGTSGGMTAAKVVNRVLAGASPGEIVLMHVGANPDDGSTLDADALPTVISKLRARGYHFVRLSRVMSAAP
jgi:peptidoglycan/xylan/chitin deacetylase (PgdA/CDA1 family)